MLRLSIRDSSGERVFATEREEILLGSREGADVRLGDPLAAPNHCLLRAVGGRLRMIALAPGGVTVGGRQVAGEAFLDAGSSFAVGSAQVSVLTCGDAAPRKLEMEGAPACPPAGPPKPPPPAKTARAHEMDFALEVRRAIAKAPWYAISLVVHVVILLLLNLIDTAQAPIDPVARMTAVAPKPMSEPEVPNDAQIDLEALVNETARLDPIEFESDPSAEAKKTPGDGEFPIEPDGAPSPTIGASGGRVRLKTPLPYAKKMSGGDETLNKSDLEGEQGRATDEVKRGLGDGFHRAKQRLSRDHIVVVRGDFDKIEDVLDKYGWPYTLVSRSDLLQLNLPKARIMFINCARRPPPAECGKLAELTKRFLSRGCWIVTSDWAVDPYVTQAFPAHVQLSNKDRSQRDTTVAVEPCCTDLLLTGVFPRGGESAWWLEDSSTMITLTDKATTLVASEDMRKRYGSGVVAFKFSYGEGVVLHLVGHFYQKDGNRRGLVAMHRLINNVILERVLADEKR